MTPRTPRSDELHLDALQAEVASLRELVEQQARREDLQQRAFDELYAELKQYKDDFIFQAEKPLLLDLLLFHDSLRWFQDGVIRKEMSAEVVADSFQFLVDEFLELLYRRDVVPVEPREGFDRETQKAIQVIPTDDRGMDWKVDHVVKRGFTRGGKVLRPDEVVIHRLKSAAPKRGSDE
jgi:molecular chaperone GrpE (heat shock protein)